MNNALGYTPENPLELFGLGCFESQRGLYATSEAAKETESPPTLPTAKISDERLKASKSQHTQTTLSYMWGLMTSEDEHFGTGVDHSSPLEPLDPKPPRSFYGSDEETDKDELFFEYNQTLKVENVISNQTDTNSQKNTSAPKKRKRNPNKAKKIGNKTLNSFLGIPEPPIFNGRVVLKIGSEAANIIEKKLQALKPTLPVTLRYKKRSMIVKLRVRSSHSQTSKHVTPIQQVITNVTKSPKQTPIIDEKKAVHPFFLKRPG